MNEWDIPDEAGDMGLDEQSIRCACERLLLKGGRASLMCLLADIIREHRLDQFAGMKEAAE